MKRTQLAAMAIAIVTATALPMSAAFADDHRGGKGHKGHSGHYEKGRGHGRHANRYRGHSHGHHKHGHRHKHGRGYYGRYRPWGWGCGSSLGFAYDSWSDSFRIGGTGCFY